MNNAFLPISDQRWFEPSKISNRWYINKRLRLNFQNVPNNRSNWGLSSDIRIHVSRRILEKSYAFCFIRTPYLDKMTCCLVLWRLTGEISVRYHTFLTGYLVFENKFSNARANTTKTSGLVYVYLQKIMVLLQARMQRAWWLAATGLRLGMLWQLRGLLYLRLTPLLLSRRPLSVLWRRQGGSLWTHLQTWTRLLGTNYSFDMRNWR